MLRIEGRRVLPEEERHRVKSSTSRKRAQEHAADAQQRAQERARALGFEDLVDYLLDRRLRGWGQVRIATELRVGERRALRLLQAEGLWAPRRSAPAEDSDDSAATYAAPLAEMGAMLRCRREELGLSLARLAKQTRVSIGVLFLIEHGNRRISLHSWQRIREVLGITERLLGQLWDGRSEGTSDPVTARLEAYLETIYSGGLVDLIEETGCSLAEVRPRLGRLLAESALPNGRRLPGFGY